MLNIKLPDDICSFAWDMVNKKNFGHRSIGANGNKEQQYTGILGEAMIYKIVYDKLPTYNEAGTVDIVINGKKIDIKTMGRKVYMKEDYVHNFVGYQKSFPNDIYVFNSIVKQERTIQICGWITKDDFFKKCVFTEKGKLRHRSDGTSFKTKAPLYEIENKKLNGIYQDNDVRNIK
jgi:hypothetical protein